jgi:hypothetical protein
MMYMLGTESKAVLEDRETHGSSGRHVPSLTPGTGAFARVPKPAELSNFGHEDKTLLAS